MSSGRRGGKQIRIVLSSEDMEKMQEAKAAAESATRVVMSDAQFVAGLVRWALAQ